LIERAKQSELQFSHAETKELFSNQLINKMSNAEDKKDVKRGNNEISGMVAEWKNGNKSLSN